MTRAEKVAEAQRLLGEGLRQGEIAVRMGVNFRTVSDWINDPDGSRGRARKDSYRGTCVRCGSPTTGCNGSSQAPRHCAKCAGPASRIWTEAEIIAAVHRFAERYGGPPLAYDWHVGHPYCDRERFYRDGDYPGTNTVAARFGTFNKAIEAAGYSPNPVGRYAKNPRPGDLRKAAA